MRRASQKDREEFISLIAQHSGFKLDGGRCANVFQFARLLMRYGATLGRIAETECNSPDYPTFAWKMPEAERLACFKRIDDRYQRNLDRLAKKEERIRVRVTELCKEFGTAPVFQGDPRGCVLKIQVPDGFTNDWGREGICVPTS